MNISINKKVFSEGVHTVARFAERRSASLPALSAILIIAAKEGIKLRATNLEAGVDLKVDGECKSPGVAAVPAIVLQQIATTLSSDGIVTLENTGDTLTLTSGTGKSSIKTIPYDDFPSIPFPESPKNRIVIPGASLKELFSTVSSCASTSTIRPELASIYISIEGNTLTAVATDSFRLVEKKIPLKNKSVQGIFLIPAKNALEISQALPDDDIILSFDDHQCAFVSDEGILVSRLTNATYPDYRQIIPKESVVEATILRRDFETALKQATIFADSFQKVRIGFDQKKKQFTVFARNIDIGESTERVPARISGTNLELSFNHRYLSAVLPLTSSESLTLLAAGIGRPLILKGVGDASMLYLVSPMNQ